MTLPTLDARLETVLRMIRARGHADIGTDHARLPVRLVREGRVERCVAVELNPGPLAQARRSVAQAGLTGQIEVREGDGFAPLAPAEVESASVSGMGALTILGMLKRAGQRLPPVLILQPNDSPLPLRGWAREEGYHLSAEELCPGFWNYPVLRLERASGPDPAYSGLPLDAALRYGPLLLRGGSERLRAEVQADLTRLAAFAQPGRAAWNEWEAAQAALACLSD